MTANEEVTHLTQISGEGVRSFTTGLAEVGEQSSTSASPFLSRTAPRSGVDHLWSSAVREDVSAGRGHHEQTGSRQTRVPVADCAAEIRVKYESPPANPWIIPRASYPTYTEPPLSPGRTSPPFM